MQEATWLPIPGYEGLYEVSDQGGVRSVDRISTSPKRSPMKIKGRLIKLQPKNGYLVAGLSKDGIATDMYVHRLVLMAFVGPPLPGQEALHGNDIRNDNRLENLSWDTHSQNMLDAVERDRHFSPNKLGSLCRRGHRFGPPSNGRRSCRECRRISERARYHAAKTHCKRGHELTPENTYLRGTYRMCSTCRELRRSGLVGSPHA